MLGFFKSADIFFGSLIGAVVGMLRTIDYAVISYPLGAYIHVLRGTPFLIHLYLVYFILPTTGISWLQFEAFPAAGFIGVGKPGKAGVDDAVENAAGFDVFQSPGISGLRRERHRRNRDSGKGNRKAKGGQGKTSVEPTIVGTSAEGANVYFNPDDVCLDPDVLPSTTETQELPDGSQPAPPTEPAPIGHPAPLGVRSTGDEDRV